jgi:hypothetical protein
MAGTAGLTGSVSSATRPAGKYTLKWDGKDSQGKPAPPGKYTVFILDFIHLNAGAMRRRSNG